MIVGEHAPQLGFDLRSLDGGVFGAEPFPAGGTDRFVALSFQRPGQEHPAHLPEPRHGPGSPATTGRSCVPMCCPNWIAVISVFVTSAAATEALARSRSASSAAFSSATSA